MTMAIRCGPVDADGDPITFSLLESPAGATIDPATGAIAWQPPGPGTYAFTVQAADDRGGMDTQTYVLTVTAGAAEPEPDITSTPPTVPSRDGTSPTLSPQRTRMARRCRIFLTDGTGRNVDRLATGEITWTPQFEQIGVHSATVPCAILAVGRARRRSPCRSAPTWITTRPTITSTPPDVVEAGAVYRYAVTATDADADALYYDLPLQPVGMSIHATTGLITWRPTDEQIGAAMWSSRLRDGHGGHDLQAFEILVRGPNTPPVVTLTPPSRAVVDRPLRYAVHAQDAENDPLTYRLDAAPTDMSIDADTGRVVWTPAAGQIGLHPVTVAVTDAYGGEVTQSFTIEVVATAANEVPAVVFAPRDKIQIGGTYYYRVPAVEPDYDPLTYSLPTAPVGMTVDEDGLVVWQPTGDQAGMNSVEIRVDDGQGGVVTDAFTIEVISQPENQTPVITSTPRMGTTVGQPYAYDVQAVDFDGDPLVYTFDQAPAGMSIDALRGTVRWTARPTQLGHQPVTVRVTDAQGASTTQVFVVTVRAVNTPPHITSPPPTDTRADVLYSYSVRPRISMATR